MEENFANRTIRKKFNWKVPLEVGFFIWIIFNILDFLYGQIDLGFLILSLLSLPLLILATYLFTPVVCYILKPLAFLLISFGKKLLPPEQSTKLVGWLMVIGAIGLFCWSILLNLAIFTTMNTSARITSHATTSFFSSLLLLPLGIFLLKKKKWAQKVAIILICTWISFLLSPLSHSFLDIHNSVLPPFALGFLVLLFLILWDKEFYCQTISKEKCANEAKVSFKSGVISLLSLCAVIVSARFNVSLFLNIFAGLSLFILPLSSLIALSFGIIGLSSEKKEIAKRGILFSLPGILSLIIGLIDLVLLYR